MQPKEMTQQVIAFQKRVVDNWDGALALVESQTTASLNWMLDTATWIPDEGRKAVDQWITIVKEERGRLKSHLDQRLTAVEKIFTPPEKPVSEKPVTVKPKTNPIKKKKETIDESV
jgi:hypothetical protein